MTVASIDPSVQVSLQGSSGSPNLDAIEKAIVSYQQERQSTHQDLCQTIDTVQTLYKSAADTNLSLKMALLGQDQASSAHTTAHQAKMKALNERLSLLHESVKKLSTKIDELTVINQSDIKQIEALAATHTQLTTLANTCCGGIAKCYGLLSRMSSNYTKQCRHTVK
jgi:hypothetical protein